jgi:hypothetical protein
MAERRGELVENGIDLKVIWFDEVEDLLEILFCCSNGYFSGQAEIYVTHVALAKLANTLSGFPSCPKDSRHFELGTFSSEHADGGVRMHFHGLDSVGHAAVNVKLRGTLARASVKSNPSRSEFRLRQLRSIRSCGSLGRLAKPSAPAPLCIKRSNQGVAGGGRQQMAPFGDLR